MPARLHRRSLWITALLVGGMLSSMLAVGWLTWQHALRSESTLFQRQLAARAQALVQRVDRYRTLPEVLALDMELRQALQRPLGPQEVQALNRKLERVNGASQSSTLTLIDRRGMAIAASNWQQPRSNVGQDYGYRPYVQQALAAGSGRFYGIGTTTGQPGYFLSQAIDDDAGAVIGLIAIKIELHALEHEWPDASASDVMAVSDGLGIIFLSSHAAWRYRLLRPLTPQAQAELAATRQYQGQTLAPLVWRERQRLADGGRLVTVEDAQLPRQMLLHSMAVPGTGWQMHLLHDTRASAATSRWAAAATAGLWLAGILLVLFARQRQRTSRVLEAARQQAERANRYKTRFVNAAVHDLLQPLNAARMFTSLLPNHVQDEAGRRVAESIESALASQDAILASLLDIARMESGQLEVHVRDFALDALLQVVHNNFCLLADSEGLQLRTHACALVVRSDEALLRRIVQNFVSNAIRYTRTGRIVVGCRRVGRQVRIEVHDQGPGIPASLQREIFEEFRRLDEGHADDRGTGLGLAIVERLGKLLGHPIGLRSTPGRGSVFWVQVPLGDARALPPAAPSGVPTGQEDAPLQGRVVWYIDDDPQTCAATCALLERWGCAVPCAAGPQEALALALAHPQAVPHLVLLDVHLGGGLYGPDFYAQLSAQWGQAPSVILVTAEHDAALRRQAAERGWGFLAKPVRPPALRALMSQTLLRMGEGDGR